MVFFWALMTVLWLVLMISNMANGESTDHAAVMVMLFIVLLNIEGIKRKMGGE